MDRCCGAAEFPNPNVKSCVPRKLFFPLGLLRRLMIEISLWNREHALKCYTYKCSGRTHAGCFCGAWQRAAALTEIDSLHDHVAFFDSLQLVNINLVRQCEKCCRTTGDPNPSIISNMHTLFLRIVHPLYHWSPFFKNKYLYVMTKPLLNPPDEKMGHLIMTYNLSSRMYASVWSLSASLYINEITFLY